MSSLSIYFTRSVRIAECAVRTNVCDRRKKTNQLNKNVVNACAKCVRMHIWHFCFLFVISLTASTISSSLKSISAIISDFFRYRLVISSSELTGDNIPKMKMQFICIFPDDSISLTLKIKLIMVWLLLYINPINTHMIQHFEVHLIDYPHCYLFLDWLQYHRFVHSILF